MSACVICSQQINNSNDSKEHIINESIGGLHTVKGFICRNCNNVTGHAWDSKLSSQLHALSLIFGVARQRGKTPPLSITTTSGENLTIMPEGGYTPTRPIYTVDESASESKIHITARSMNEARNILKGVKKKYPQIDIENLLAGAEISRTYPTGLIKHNLDFGGEASGRSIIKSLLAMGYRAGIPSTACTEATSYLRNIEAAPCYGFYYETDLIAARPSNTPLNCVAVEANPATGLILGYAEYFGVHRIIACLGRNYEGNLNRSSYTIDPRTGQEIKASLKLEFNEEEITAIYNYKKIPDIAIAQAFNKILPEALKRQYQAEKKHALDLAITYALSNCGAKEGEMLTEEHLKKIANLITEKIMPFVIHGMKK